MRVTVKEWKKKPQFRGARVKGPLLGARCRAQNTKSPNYSSGFTSPARQPAAPGEMSPSFSRSAQEGKE